jgi:acetyl/propionyl-CoA carboxylase alpha subunit
VPGTKGLVESDDEAAQESERLGFPVMLKGISISNKLIEYWIIS